MADDDATVFRTARAAAASARRNLGSARSQISAARRAFTVPVGMSWGTVGDKLAKRKACADGYRELQSALDAADAAVARAEAACTKLDKAARA